MILKYKLTVFPYGGHKAEDYYETLEFVLQFTEDLDNFIRLWFDNYPKCRITIEADDSN